MSFLESLRIGLFALRLHALRSALTLVGIVIGTASVIVMIAMGTGLNAVVADRIADLGTNILLVEPGSTTLGAARLGTGSRSSLTEAHAAAIAAEVPGIAAVAPSVRGRAQAVNGNRNWSTVVGGVVPDYLRARDWGIARGRIFTRAETVSAAKVAVLGASVVRRLFGDEDPLNQIARVNDTPFVVVGILHEKGQAATGSDQDDVILMPLATAKRRVLGTGGIDRRAIDYIIVKAADERAMPLVKEQVQDLLRQRARSSPAPDDFRVTDPVAAMETGAAIVRSVSILFAAVAAISLVVGGVTITNVMLVSVAERTREIGIRLALGARPGTVRNQFLMEAAILTTIGGTVGLILGVAVSRAFSAALGWPIGVPATTMIAILAFSAALGVGFGFYPAVAASRLDPCEALRCE